MANVHPALNEIDAGTRDGRLAVAFTALQLSNPKMV